VPLTSAARTIEALDEFVLGCLMRWAASTACSDAKESSRNARERPPNGTPVCAMAERSGVHAEEQARGLRPAARYLFK